MSFCSYDFFELILVPMFFDALPVLVGSLIGFTLGFYLIEYSDFMYYVILFGLCFWCVVLFLA